MVIVYKFRVIFLKLLHQNVGIILKLNDIGRKRKNTTQFLITQKIIIPKLYID